MIQQSYFFDIQYSLLQNNIFKLEMKLYLLSTGTIDHDELFLRNLLSEQVHVFSFSLNFQQFYKSVFVVKSYKTSMINLLTSPLNCKITWQFLNTTNWLSFQCVIPSFQITELSPLLQELSFLLAGTYIKSFCPVEAVKSLTKICWTYIGKT